MSDFSITRGVEVTLYGTTVPFCTNPLSWTVNPSGSCEVIKVGVAQGVEVITTGNQASIHYKIHVASGESISWCAGTGIPWNTNRQDGTMVDIGTIDII